jgi:hypothetical protein
MKPEERENLVLETFESVLRVTLDRPERRNALSEELMLELLVTQRSGCSPQPNTKTYTTRPNRPPDSRIPTPKKGLS